MRSPFVWFKEITTQGCDRYGHNTLNFVDRPVKYYFEE
jgi:hypothetical protein